MNLLENALNVLMEINTGKMNLTPNLKDGDYFTEALQEGFFNDTKLGRGIRNGALGLGMAAGAASCNSPVAHRSLKDGIPNKGEMESLYYQASPNNGKFNYNDSTDIWFGSEDEWGDPYYRDNRLNNRSIERMALKLMQDEGIDKETALEIAMNQLHKGDQNRKQSQKLRNQNTRKKYGL